MPTRDTPWPAGTPCWVDYNAADLEAAKAFYADLLGWTFTGGDSEFGGYLTCQADGRAAAGMMPTMEASIPPAWTTYFATDDADATATRITDAGGTIVMPPDDVGAMGRLVIALDPQGHAFGLWQAGEHTGLEVYNQSGAVVWNDAAVEDIAAAQAFYVEVFGFRFDEIPDMGGYATFATGGDPLGGLGPHEPGAPAGWTTCFAVTSTDAAAAAVEKAGGKITMAPQDSPYGRLAVLEDPWGAAFSVMQLQDG